VVNPLIKYYEGVKELIKDRCGDSVVLVLNPPLTQADKLVDKLRSELGEDRVRHYIIGSRSGRKEVEALRGILEEIRKGGGLVSDEKLVSKLRALLGDELVGGVKPGCVIPYYIAWEEARRYVSDENVDEGVKNALMLIIKEFEGRGRRIAWFGLDYMPEELVEEAMNARDEDVEGWVGAYLYIVSKLGLDGGFLHDVKMVFKRFIEPIKASLTTIGQATHVVPELFTQMGAVALSFIESLAKDEVHAFRDIIDAVTRLKALRRGGDLNTLGKLIAYKLAVDMGIPYEVVHNVLVGFTGLADDVLRDIEERLDVIEIKSQSVEGAFRVYDKGGFEGDAEAHPGFLIINDELLIQGGVIGGSALETYRVVTTRGFNDLRDEVLRRLNDEGVVVLVGPRGIGKTTLAAYVTWTLLREGRFRFMVNVKDIEEVGTEFTGFIGYYLGNKYDDKYGDLLVVYDPSTTKTYSLADKRTEVPKGISNTLDTLLRYIAEDEKVRGRVRLLVVLPTDIHQALPQDLKDRLGKYVLDLEKSGFLKDPEFLAEVIREYARGCSIDYDKAKALADEILGRFSEGYTLIARLAGTLIADRYECRVDDVRRVIEESRGNAHYLILRYINTLFKIHEDPDTAKALVEIFTLRRPFVNITRPGIPILTPGIIKLIGEKKGASLLYSAEGKELRGWLALRQHDLIEESIEELLRCIANEGEECKELGDALEPWKTIGVMESLGKVSEVKDVGSAVKYFVDNYGKEFITTLGSFGNCWKRAALIIGHALAGRILVTGPEDLSVFLPENLRKSVVGSLGDALNRCEIDDYLLVGNKIPPLIWYLVLNNARVSTEAFIDKYDEAVGEVRRVRDTARGRGISDAEGVYGLGLASIIAYAAGLGKVVESGGADAALHIASFAIQHVALPDLIRPILSALRPLRDYAPHRYLSLLFSALSIENLDHDTVRYILDELNGILDNYGDVVKRYAWSLVHAIIAHAILLMMHLVYFYGELENIIGRVVGLLNELDKLSPSLGIIAWAHALAPALRHGIVRRPMEKALGINVVDKAGKVLDELSRLRGRVQELMSDEEFRSYVESMYIKTDEEAVKGVILGVILFLKHALAQYRLDNDELDEAARLFNEVAEESREIGDYENHLISRGWVLRVGAIKGSLVSDELVNLVKKFQQLYEETFSKEHFIPTAHYLSAASHVLGGYLVSLALTGDHETISKLLEERWHWRVLNANKQASVLTRLTLNALLGPRGKLSSELKGRLIVEPRELVDAFVSDMHSGFLPALIVALGITKPEDGIKQLRELREWLIDAFHKLVSEEKVLGWLKGFGFDAESLINEFKGLVNGLDGKSLVRLIAPASSRASLAFMLYALINGNEKLARAHALIGIVEATGNKLLKRLFLEAYRACCDPNNEEFRRAIARLFFYHV